MNLNINLPNVSLSNPINTLTDIYALPGRVAADLTENIKREVNGVVAQGTGAASISGIVGVDAVFDRMRTAEQAARAKALNDTIDDRDIDNVTKNEIQALYDSGANSTQIAGLMAAAKEGKGIYAVRKIHYNQDRIRADQPGRMQLSAIKTPAPGTGSDTIGFQPAATGTAGQRR